MASEETKKVDGTETVKPEVKVDERAVKLTTDYELSLAKSATLEAEIEKSKTLRVYAAAGNQHAETTRLDKAIEEYGNERNGVASTWTETKYWNAINSITMRIRSNNPDFFVDSIVAKGSKAPAHDSARVHTRLQVGLLYKLLIELIGDKAGDLPYGTIANYVINKEIVVFDPASVTLTIRECHVEFLKNGIGDTR
jgi:hypothetical protein